jgi:Domain of unknown function (DUF1929)
MVNVFRPVPDWGSWENQGGGIAIGSLAGDSTQDLVVLGVDNPAGQNRGRYRVGRALDSSGQVTGGWGPWLEVPDWFSHENQGANIALADLDGDGRQELIVAMVDNPGGQNRGVFRLGRQLDTQGNVTGGWTPWMDVPDWFSWENQGIAVTCTPPDQQGTRDLVVAMVDNGPEANRGLYRVASNLDVDGNVAGWTPWLEVPDWFSWENQGCGVAVADLDRDGGRDLIVFHIDNPVGQNQAFFRIGANLGGDGIPAGGWGPWLGVPNWFSWENQGGGIAVADLGGVWRLVGFMIDNPPLENAGLYELMDLEQDPATYGTWEVLEFHSGVLAVHAALLPNGKVLFFAGSGSSAKRFNSPLFGDEGQGVFTSVVWTPPDNTFSHPPTLRTANGRPYDLFCGGDGFLADGRMLSAGGTLNYNPFRGRRDTAIFDFRTEQWSFAAPLAQGRWYPTLIPLGDGTILAASGLGEDDGDQPKITLELYSAAANSWQTRQLPAGFPGLPLYAHLFLLADGRVFFSGGRMDDPLEVAPCLLDLTNNPVSTTTVPDLLAPDMRNQSASVLLPPAQAQQIMIVGGGPVGIPNKTDATDAVSIVDLTDPNPIYQAGAPIGLPRLHLNAVLLPDRTVFVSGGSLKQEDEPLARLQAERYDPATGSWSLMATATVPRLYHSTAVLLADGRVVAAGGNPEGGDQVAWEPPSPVEELRLEVFSPPYLFKGPRPTIGTVVQQWAYGQAITVPSPQASEIRWASLVKNGVTTHSFDSGQRLVDLEITARASDSIQVTVPGNPNLAPPGWYMLFLVDQRGVPSVATWIHLS